MPIRLLSSNLEDVTISRNPPVDLHTKLQFPAADAYYAVAGRNRLIIQQKKLSHFEVYHIDMIGASPEEIRVICSKSSLILHISLKDSIKYSISGLKEVVLHERGYNIYYIPSSLTSIQIRNTHHKSMLLLFPEYLLQDIIGESQVFNGILATIALQRPVKFIKVNQIAPYRLIKAAEKILNAEDAKKTEELSTIFLVNAVEKIIHAPKKEPIHLSQKKIDKVYLAKELVASDPAKRLTLQQIAGGCGMKVSQVRTWFPQIFGMSVTDFQTERLMDKAMRMLKMNGNYTIETIAAELGFTQGSSLTRAFKKFYGFLPTEYIQKCQGKMKK